MRDYNQTDLDQLRDLTNYTESVTCLGKVSVGERPFALIFVGVRGGEIKSCHVVGVAWLEQLLKQAKGEENEI